MKRFENLRKYDLVWASFEEMKDHQYDIVEIIESIPYAKCGDRKPFYIVRDGNNYSFIMWKSDYRGSLTKKEIFAYIMAKK